MAKKQKSSGQLYKFIEDRDIAEATKARKEYGDRGQAGKGMIDADYDRRKAAKERDEELVYQYGKDAPKARNFGTDKQYSVSRTKTARARKPKTAK